MSKAKRFVQVYNEFDKEIKKILALDGYMSHSRVLDRVAKQNKLIALNLDELKTYAKLRNCLVHDVSSIIDRPIAEPVDEIIDNYESILNRLRNPLTVIDVCTHRSNLLVTSKEQNVIDLMRVMEDQLVSRVPILEDDKVIGVFNGNTVIYYTINEEHHVTDNIYIEDIMKYAQLKSHRKEHFDFVDKKLTVFEAEELFKEQNKNNHKLIALFITSNGRENGKLLGIVTEWDIFNKVT